MELIRRQRFDEAEKEMKQKRREVGQAKKRIAELDRIFKRIYDDDINGTISHERFLKLSAEYEAEQKELTEKLTVQQQEVDTYEQDKNDFDSFAAIIRKYVGITELTPAIVHEFIMKIIVHAPDKIDGIAQTNGLYRLIVKYFLVTVNLRFFNFLQEKNIEFIVSVFPVSKWLRSILVKLSHPSNILVMSFTFDVEMPVRSKARQASAPKECITHICAI